MSNYNATVIAPCRNELNHIDDFINSIKEQVNFSETEFIIADGLSDDGTREKLIHYSSVYKNIIIVDNPLKIVSTGLNVAIAKAKNSIIIRMDIHSEYDNFYIRNCIDCLISRDAQCVGGAWLARSKNSKQRAISASFQSKWVVGGAKSRDLNYSGEVDTVYLGCWWKDYLLKIGGFDENLVRNQDDELCMRIILDGKKIFQDSSIKSFYYPRSNFKDLFKQYMQYGYWKVFVIKKFGRTASLRHLALILFFSLLLLTSTASIFLNSALYLVFGLLIPYFLFVFAISVNIKIEKHDVKFHYLIISIFIMHFSYALGMIRGFIFNIKPDKDPKNTMNDLSR